MKKSEYLQSPPLSVLVLCLWDQVYHKQKIRLFLCLLGQIVT